MFKANKHFPFNWDRLSQLANGGSFCLDLRDLGEPKWKNISNLLKSYQAGAEPGQTWFSVDSCLNNVRLGCFYVTAMLS